MYISSWRASCDTLSFSRACCHTFLFSIVYVLFSKRRCWRAARAVALEEDAAGGGGGGGRGGGGGLEGEEEEEEEVAVCEEQMAVCEELLSVEPGSKWALLTQLYLLSLLQVP